LAMDSLLWSKSESRSESSLMSSQIYAQATAEARGLDSNQRTCVND